MSKDMTVQCDNGLINIRVGAIILKDGKFLMVGNHIRPEYLYSVGGRIKFGETAKEAVIREVYEETGLHLRSAHFCGVIRFRADMYEDEDMYLYVSDDFEPVDPGQKEAFRKSGKYDPPECNEGELVWVPHEKMPDLPAWEGDRAFLSELLRGTKDINMRLQYEGESCTVTRL